MNNLNRCNSRKTNKQLLVEAIHLLHKLNRKSQKIMASQKEEADKLAAIGDKLDKAAAEILAAIKQLKDALAAAGGTTPEVDAATDRLTAGAQALDDIVPDA